MRASFPDIELYPFRSNYLPTGDGAVHYVDEGNGSPILFVHGNPEWSFSFREPIRALSATYRCLAPDHLGFGLSEKPPGGDLSPQAHARRLTEFIDRLGLEGVTLVMNDWGGPIGICSALERTDRIAGLVVLNAWLWPLNDRPLFQLYSRFMRSPIGKVALRKGRILIRWGMPWGFGKMSRFSRRISFHYEAPFEAPADPRGQWEFAREILASKKWLEALWEKRQKLCEKPTLILKGKKDLAFGKRTLRKWERGFPWATVRELPDAGHFPQEEKGEGIGRRIRAFMEHVAG
ncbi:MAG: alpha/beta fold hydrolase [Flavobacteriales bacterium]